MSTSETNSLLSVQLTAGCDLQPAVWDAWVAASLQANIYALHGYASAVLPGWQACIVSDAQGRWQAVLPLAISHKWGQKLAYTPFFAQNWGPMLAAHPHTGERKFAHERLCLQALAQALHKLVGRAGIQAHPSLRYAAPFSWAGFRLETRYTWQISLLAPEAELWAALADTHQRQVRKGQKNGIRYDRLQDTSRLRELAQLNALEGHPIWHGGETTANMYQRIADYLISSGNGGLYGAFDGETLLAAALFAEAFGTRHYLAGAMHPAFRDTGAMTFLLWNGIRQAHELGLKTFDFEGSMQSSIETFFRKFGAEPVSYLKISRPLLAKVPLLHRFT